MLPMQLKGLGYYLPENPISSESLDKKLNLAPGTVENKSGIKLRHFALPKQTAAELGAIAAHRALQDAEMSLSDIDVIVGACGVGQQAIPCTAALFQKALGLENSGIPCFDINSTCLSFISAVETLSYMILGDRFKNALIISCELPSRGLNWQDLETCTIFGDGAAACVLTKSEGSSKILSSHLQTHSIGSEYCCLKAGGTNIPAKHIAEYQSSGLFYMDGKKVFKLASKLIKQSTTRLLNKAGLTMEDVDWVIPHQASKLALHHIQKQHNIPDEKYGNVYDGIGNQMAASIPTAMCRLREQGKLTRGQTLYLLGSGAGLAAGGLILVF